RFPYPTLFRSRRWPATGLLLPLSTLACTSAAVIPTSLQPARRRPVENADMDPSPTYVLITPARNEAAFIEQTINSVVRQTIRPLKWVIVSDGSTDRTDDLVRNHAARHPWIELVTLTGRTQRHFAGKVAAFNAGYARLEGLRYDVIGNLDGDVSFEDDY